MLLFPATLETAPMSWPIIFSSISAGVTISAIPIAVIALIYFKYVRYPDSVMEKDLGLLTTDFETLKGEFEELLKNFDVANQSRIREAILAEELRSKIEILRLEMKELENKYGDLRVDIAKIPGKK